MKNNSSKSPTLKKHSISNNLFKNTLPEIYIDDCIRELTLMSQVCPAKLHSRFSGMYDFYEGLIKLVDDSAPSYSKKEFFDMMDQKVKNHLTKQGLKL
jgi:hypothetical protein